MLVQQIMDGIVKVANLMPQERVLRRTVEETVDTPLQKKTENEAEMLEKEQTERKG